MTAAAPHLIESVVTFRSVLLSSADPAKACLVNCMVASLGSVNLLFRLGKPNSIFEVELASEVLPEECSFKNNSEAALQHAYSIMRRPVGVATLLPSLRLLCQALIRKKVRVVDKDALVQIKIPFPLPLSWGRNVKPYEPAPCLEAQRDGTEDTSDAEPCIRGIEQDSILAMDWSAVQKDFQVSRRKLGFASISMSCRSSSMEAVPCISCFQARKGLYPSHVMLDLENVEGGIAGCNGPAY